MKRVTYKFRFWGIVALIILASLSLNRCYSQNNKQQKENKKENQKTTITSDQASKIKSILSKYNSATLTAAQAKEIHEKFREVGIHVGPETKEAIISAGFDPEKLRTLAPPPNGKMEQKTQGLSLDERLKSLEEKVIKPLSLNSTQKESIISAFKVFYNEMDSLRKNQVNPQSRPDRTKVEPIEKSRDEKIKKILTNDQFLKYVELEKANRPARPDEDKTKK